MKRIQYYKFGGAETMRLEEFEIQALRSGQVAAQAHYASTNPHRLEGAARRVEMLTGKSFPRPMGADFSGTVIAVGTGVTKFKPGDAVFCMASLTASGALGEAVVTDESLLSRSRTLFRAGPLRPQREGLQSSSENIKGGRTKPGTSASETSKGEKRLDVKATEAPDSAGASSRARDQGRTGDVLRTRAGRAGDGAPNPLRTDTRRARRDRTPRTDRHRRSHRAGLARRGRPFDIF
jgi:hypothetical protein